MMLFTSLFLILATFAASGFAQYESFQEVPETCKLQPRRGRGNWRFDFWYYDEQSNDCRWMAARSPYGNANRFVSRYACIAYCKFGKTEPCETVSCGDRASCRAVQRTKCEAPNSNGNGNGNGNGNWDVYRDATNEQGTDSGCPPDFATCEIPNGNISYRLPPTPNQEMYQWKAPDRCEVNLRTNLKASQQTDALPRMLVYYRKRDRKCKGFYVYPPVVSSLAGQTIESALGDLIQNTNAFFTLEDCMSTCAE